MRTQVPGPGWTVLVTGASSGLGRCLAIELARAGCSLVLTGRNLARLEAVGLEVRAAGATSVWTFTTDFAEGGAESLLAERELPEIDALVNNAGAGQSGPWSEGSLPGDRKLLQLLVDTPLALTRAFLPLWRLRGRGAVLNVASTGAFQPGPQTAVYYAAKAFLASWSLALAREERSWLTVTTFCPGALKTGFSVAAGKKDIPGSPSPDDAARKAVRAWRTGRGLVIPGFGNKVLVFVSRLLPLAWTTSAVEKIQLSVIETRTGGNGW